MAKSLMKGCEAIGEAAVRAGCRYFFGYPITPQTEIPEYLARRLPEVGGTFLQAESEVAAINMLLGAGGAGVRVFTSSSSPGISLMSEGLSYIAASEVPVVLINIVRSGPGLGGILPAQSDYRHCVKGTAHGDFKLIVLAPASVQEAVDLVRLAFDLSDKYRNPALIIGDGMIGQMMEPVEFPDFVDPETLPNKPWACTGAKGRPPNIINSLYLDAAKCNDLNFKLAAKYREVEANEKRWDTYNCEAPHEILIVAYGTMARICRTSIDELKEGGLSVGLFRPISLYPYPYEALAAEIHRPGVKRVLVVEMSMGQMVDDVKLAALGRVPIDFYGKAGGVVPAPEEVLAETRRLAAL
jgi:2-oxoglutarate/2-oxoacid ferredoxin oxidoreductase subunit alpha